MYKIVSILLVVFSYAQAAEGKSAEVVFTKENSNSLTLDVRDMTACLVFLRHRNSGPTIEYVTCKVGEDIQTLIATEERLEQAKKDSNVIHRMAMIITAGSRIFDPEFLGNGPKDKCFNAFYNDTPQDPGKYMLKVTYDDKKVNYTLGRGKGEFSFS